MPTIPQRLDAIDAGLDGMRPEVAVRRQSEAEAVRQLNVLLRECRHDPVKYAREVLYTEPSATQCNILQACVEWPWRVSIASGQNLGKSWVLGTIANWRYDCWGGIVVTTAPKQESVVDILWKEVRVQRERNPLLPWDFIGPAAPKMRRSPDHWAAGYVANKNESFKGRHVRYMAFLYDEAVALAEMYFRALKGMFKPGGDHLAVCAFNPTDPASPMYAELERNSAGWRQFSLSCLDHPNVIAHLRGEPEPIPAAVSFHQINDAVEELCEPVLAREDRGAEDFCWPPVLDHGRWTTKPADPHRNGHAANGSELPQVANWRRPAPDFCCDWMGVWPPAGPHQLWHEALWKAVCEPATGPIVACMSELPQVGIDTATTGDYCSFHVRWGVWSILHESRSGIRPTEIEGKAKEMAAWCAELVNKARQLDGGNRPLCKAEEIPMVIDDDGVGRGVSDHLLEDGYRTHPVNAATRPILIMRYPNKRSELWFQTRDKAYKGFVKLCRLSRKLLEKIKPQFVQTQWELNSAGQRVVEPKEITRERLGRSPDDADSINLSYYSVDSVPPSWVDTPNVKPGAKKDGTYRDERFKPLFGRR